MLMVFVKRDTTMKNPSDILVYEHDNPKKHVFSPYMETLRVFLSFIYRNCGKIEAKKNRSSWGGFALVRVVFLDVAF